MNRVRAKSALYVADVFASVPREDQWAKGDRYLRGLMPDGRRKSISAGQGWWNGTLPGCRLLVEWPEDAEAPTEYGLSSPPADTRSPTWSVRPGSAGASSTTTADSSTAWAWTTSKAGPGPAGTTTSPS